MRVSRKYKKCHLGHEQLPLADRVGWLYIKAWPARVALTGWNDLLAEVTDERSRYSTHDNTEPDALTDPLVVDAVLFEGGAFAEFLQIRGPLLPDDERLLAEQWLLVDRSVFEVEQVHPGQGVTVRDVRTGDTHEVRERAASRHLKPGQLVCARVVPAGDTNQFFGGLEPVALHERDRLMNLLDTEPDAVELVAYLSRRFAPPALTNTEGDPLAICEATVRVGDPARIMAALDDAYDRGDGDDPPRWFEHVTTQGMQRIRAALVLDGYTLRVEANSEKRMDRVLATLARLDPEMSVLDDSRRPLQDAREAAELARQLPITGADALDPDDPGLAAILDQFVRDYETKWLDEPIPALDGHTPLQAADDPTRRADLIKLLETFPAGDAPAAAWTPTGCAPRWACGNPGAAVQAGAAAPISAANSRKSLWPGSFCRHCAIRSRATSLLPRRCASRAERNVCSGPPNAACPAILSSRPPSVSARFSSRRPCHCASARDRSCSVRAAECRIRRVDAPPSHSPSSARTYCSAKPSHVSATRSMCASATASDVSFAATGPSP